MRRVIFDVVLILSIFLLPWWISAVGAIVGIFVFRSFYEFIVTFLIIYALFAVPEGRIIASPYWFSICISLIYIVIQTARRYIILYKS